MEDPNVSPDPNQAPNADQRIAELEAKLSDVNRRYAASSEEGKRLAQTVQQLQSSYVQPRQDVTRRDSAGQRLTDLGIPVDALDEYVEQKAQGLIEARFRPLMQGIQARQTMMGRYKDYGKFESDIGELLNSDAEFNQMYTRVFEADPVAAFELAYHRLGETKRKSRNGTQPGRDDVVEHQIPTNRSGDSHRAPRGSDAEVSETARAFREKPSPANAQAYAKARLKTAIPDEFLNQ